MNEVNNLSISARYFMLEWLSGKHFVNCFLHNIRMPNLKWLNELEGAKASSKKVFTSIFFYNEIYLQWKKLLCTFSIDLKV